MRKNKVPNIFIKRDDLTGLALGGNKTRKLEYLMHDAINFGAEIIITIGCLQSNSSRQTAAACRLLNLECYLFLIKYPLDMNPDKPEGNMLLSEILGANIILCENEEEAEIKSNDLMNRLKKEKKKHYFIPIGGSNEIGYLGYVNAMKEIAEDEKRLNVKFDYIVFASCSFATQCGLVIGNKLFNDQGKIKRKINGICICHQFLYPISDEQIMLKGINDFCSKNNLNLKFSYRDINYDKRYQNTGYAVLSENDKRGIDIFAKTEAIILDPVYTGRAAGGLIKMIENGEFDENTNVLFIHTGGAPSIFTDLYKRVL